MKLKLVLSISLIVFLLTACAPQGAPSAPTPMPTSIVVQKPTYAVQRGEVIKVLELRGRVAAVRQEELFFGTSGVVDEVLVSRGDTVKAGQVLAYLTERETHEAAVAEAELDLVKSQKALDSLKEEAGLHSAEDQVEMLKAQVELQKARNERLGLEKPRADEITIAKQEAILAMLEINLREARKQYEKVDQKRITNPDRLNALMVLEGAIQERNSALARLNWYTGHATEQQIAEADAKVALAEAKYQEAVRKYESSKTGPDPDDVALAEATLARSQMNLKKAQATLGSLTITASFDGQVLSTALTPGMQVTAYKTVLTVVDPAGLEVTVLPTSSDLAEISVGQKAQVHLPNQPGLELTGLVRYLPLQSSGSSEPVVDQSVRIALEDGNTLLTMGEAATVLIRLEERQDVLWIPPAALRTFQGRDFVIVQDGDVQRRVDIRLGLKNPERVEILEGLSENQVVLGP